MGLSDPLSIHHETRVIVAVERCEHTPTLRGSRVLGFALCVKRDNCEQFSLLDKCHSEIRRTDLAPNAGAEKIKDISRVRS